MENSIQPYNSKPKYYKEEAYLRAQKRLKELKGFYWHAAVYVLVNLFLIILIGVNSSGGFWHFGTLATPFFWGFGLLFHGLSVFGPTIIFNKDWEDRKIQEYMDKEEQNAKRFQ